MTNALVRGGVRPVFEAPRTTALGLTGHTDRSATLGVINYLTGSAEPHIDRGYPEIDLWMSHTPQEGFTERWTTDAPVEHGLDDGIVYAHDGETLFCAGRIAPSASYTRATRKAYLSALGLASFLGYSQLFRMWNFIEKINQDNVEGLEIYRDFCRGRAEAFERFGVRENGLPAATGIGSLGGGIGFYFLATRGGRARHIENSRQISAYHYPPVHGPRSPSFARGTYLDEQLFVSGTASILGHETVHAGDLRAQAETTFANIEHLISAENLAAHGIDRGYALSDLNHIKVYVRHTEDVALVRELCLQRFPYARMAFLNVAICRSDLLLEIEGIAS
jgi:chorismatase